MRFMVIVKTTKDSENEGAPHDPQLMADMNKFNDELLEAGVLTAPSPKARNSSPASGSGRSSLSNDGAVLAGEVDAGAFGGGVKTVVA